MTIYDQVHCKRIVSCFFLVLSVRLLSLRDVTRFCTSSPFADTVQFHQSKHYSAVYEFIDGNEEVFWDAGVSVESVYERAQHSALGASEFRLRQVDVCFPNLPGWFWLVRKSRI